MKTALRVFFCVAWLMGSSAYAHKLPEPDADCSAWLVEHVDWNQDWLKDQSELHQLWSQQPANPLWKEWFSAEQRVADLEKALKGMSKTDLSYFEPIVKAARAALTKHQLIFLRQHDLKRMDVPRHLAILRAIAAFDASKARFSLYKIKRAIEGRYSLRQYSDCRL